MTKFKLIINIHTYIHTLYYDSSIRGYSVVIYNNNKYTIIKLQWGKNIYICYNKKYLHEFVYSHKNLVQSKKSLQESGRRLSF